MGQVIQVSSEAVKFVSGHFIGPLAFHSATTTLEDPCDKGDLRHLFGLMVQNLVSMIDDLRGERR